MAIQTTAFAQKAAVVADIDSMIAANDHAKAHAIIKERIAGFFQLKNIDTLDSYVVYLGKTSAALKNATAAKAALQALIQKAIAAFPYNNALVPVYFEAASYFSNAGDHQQAYQTLLNLQAYFKPATPGLSPENLSALYSNLGDYAQRQGKYALASENYLTSIDIMKLIRNPDQQKLYFANNSLGIVMWYSSKLDSAVHYFNKAVDALNKMENTPLNRHFRVALVQNNIAGCYNVMGKTSEAIEMFEQVINHNKQFIASPDPHPKKENARINQFASVDNLAKVYLELGDFSKAHDLLYYSYQQKLAAFGDKSPEVYKSLIFLGTIYNNQRNYSKAISFLNDALARIAANGESNTAWSAEAYSQLAFAYKNLKDNQQAVKNYELATNAYEIVYAGQYDDLYLNYLGDMSMFYAENDNGPTAISTVSKGLNYVVKSQGENSLQTVLQLRNLANVQFHLKKYNETIVTTERGIAIVNKLMSSSTAPIDSIKIEIEKPRLIFLQSKAKYELLPVPKDSAALNGILNHLYTAKNALDKRKSILFDQKDIAALTAGNNELIDFIKQLNYELYHSTGKINYLDKMMAVQEAAMYARIRSRMDKHKAIRFSGVPAAVIQQEETLKAAIQQALQGDAAQHEKIAAYIAAVNNWTAYNEQLRNKYPAYYNMRYAGKEKTLGEMCAAIPQGITVVRYFFTGNNLLALVANNKKQQLVALTADKLTEQITTLNNRAVTAEQTGGTAYALYQQLWKPLEKEITGNRVMIIPDNILYNLSFEMLSPVPCKTYRELSANCLLNKYAIGYHYSLLAVAPGSGELQSKGNFVGFSPGFTDEQKKVYSTAIKNDSMRMDNGYLNLLPLPFTTSLTKKIQDKLGGKVFLNDASTPDAFRSNAGGHSIIHIGTHAESNNEHPEYSRLIFAKDPQKATAENAVYLFDIYNCELASELAVLTACESGKPGYQDGEGMISMAHAFNYAGSRSILTGLWKIDEQASAVITDAFYKNLQQGLTKDEALRQAKLTFIKNSDGRMLSPQYWAGLVIMGDTAAINLSTDNARWYWIGAGAIVVLLLITFFRNTIKNKRVAA